jgi:hypothetical protein
LSVPRASGFFDARRHAESSPANSAASALRKTRSLRFVLSPIAHSSFSHRYGGSLFLPSRDGVGRFTVEYTDSVATQNLFGSTVQHGIAYNNDSYIDGMRYRGVRSASVSAATADCLPCKTPSPTTRRELHFDHAQVSPPANLLGNASPRSRVPGLHRRGAQR